MTRGPRIATTERTRHWEERHRRTMLFGIALLILLGMSPIVGHHIGGGLDRLFLGKDHLGDLCLIALHYLLEPVHGGFHLLLVAGFAYASFDRWRAAGELRRTLALTTWSPPAPDGAIASAARSIGLAPNCIRVADGGLPIPAFTAGWVHPRVYLAATLDRHLCHDQLVAVLSHEAAHLDRRDPLRLSALRFVCLALFWIPALRRLADDFADEAEIHADDIAARRGKRPLASALLTLAEWSALPTPDAGVGFHRPDLLVRRIRRLAGDEVPPRSHLTTRWIAAAASILLLVWVTGTAVAHPLPHQGHAEHCDHSDLPLWAHLFCDPPVAQAVSTHCLDRHG